MDASTFVVRIDERPGKWSMPRTGVLVPTPHTFRMMNPNGAHDHDHDHADHDHDHDHDHHDHGHDFALEAREKQVVMSFIEALVEERLSVNARRAVFGILRLDPSLREAGE